MFRLIVALSVLYLASGELDDRVVNGRGASVQEFPFQVSIMMNNRHFCGGSILNEKFILTAAHCLDNMNPRSLTVRAGSSIWNSGGVVRPVKAAVVHPSYNPMIGMDNDIALLEIEGTFVYSSVIKPVKIITSPVPSGTPVAVSGWGQLSDRNTNLPTSLQAAVMSYLTPNDCARYHGPAITNRMVCATGPGMDACRGDSGGPLTLPGTNTQVGVVSWGIRCADAGLPGVYTNLLDKSMISFLERYVGKMVPN